MIKNVGEHLCGKSHAMQPSPEYTSLIKSARKYTQLTPSKWKFSPNKLFAKLCKEISIPSNKYSSTLGNHQKDL